MAAAPPGRRGAALGGLPGLEHRLEPGDTLAGLALRYGVTMEQIKRANRLYTSDTIFLKPTLLIPGQLGPEEEEEEEEGAVGPACPATSRHDLSATDFLRQIDAEIRLSKAAATRQLREGDAGSVAEAEGTRTPDPGARSAPQGARRALLGPRPLTRTPRAAALRDAEDEIFTL
ncbi:lysM and putative peptidoglycan-binding domain-containing protein 1 [Rhea pennata]|uniref:lysM and putative peptidoglycan-binding domain-containing protein 1 n=1 Tax=Rhea pennata TaxID=8795 RepID=UPI002E269AEF